MTSQDWTGLILASNEAAMQWYSMVTEKPLPYQPDTIYTPLPGGGGIRLGTQSGLLAILGLALVAYLIMRD
jgi:hypothetical protein